MSTQKNDIICSARIDGALQLEKSAAQSSGFSLKGLERREKTLRKGSGFNLLPESSIQAFFEQKITKI